MKSKYLITSDGLIAIYAHEVIHLPELLLRWSYKPHIKIIKEIACGRLQLFAIINKFTDAENNIRYEIAKYNTTWLRHNVLCKDFSGFVFLTEHIKKIEHKNNEYLFKKIQKSNNSFESCTIRNINTYAPQFAYVMCKYSPTIDFDTTTEFNICLEINQNGTFINNCMEGSRESWVLPNSIIWHESSIYHDRKKRIKAHKNIQVVREFVERHKENGITSKVQLAILIDDTFPDLLTDRELGELLPAREGAVVSPSAQRKRGQRLRKKVK